jgi:signal peptide peptidase SppA
MEFSIEHEQLASVPYLEQWLGLWCIEPSALQQLVQMVSLIDIAAHKEEWQLRPGRKTTAADYAQTSNGVAVIKLAGPLQKHASSMSSAGSTVLARRAVRAAVEDSSVGAIFLDIESPGGTSAGTKELADEIQAANAVKPVFAHITDIGASAAYWVSSAAGKITANASALVGSIGTYAVAIDRSGEAAAKGIKVHVIKAGAMKGDGVPGTPVTDEALAEMQRHVDSRNDFFLAGVAQGRGLSPSEAQSLADGRVHSASTAVSLKLIDGVATYEQALEEARQAASTFLSSTSKKVVQMSDTPVTGATSKEIKAACPGCTSDFIVDCMEHSRNLEECSRLWAQELATENEVLGEQLSSTKTELEASQAELATVRAELEALKAEKPTARAGVPALPTTKEGTSPAASAQEEYWNQVRELQLAGKTRGEAMASVNRLNPQLRTAMMAEVNS